MALNKSIGLRKITAYTLILATTIITGISCNDKKDESSTVIRKDSAARVNPERSVNPYAVVDVSPMDMAYFPSDYPIKKMSKIAAATPLARVVYSRPHLQGRILFENLLKYGEPWRLGANESTELELYRDATISGQSVKAGRYIMYCIPQPQEWTIVFNSNINSWGLQQDSTMDVARFTIPAKKTDRRIEYYTMIFEKTNSGAELIMAWDRWEARLPIVF